MGACALEPQWYFYILVGLVTFFGGLIILIPCRIAYYWFIDTDVMTSKPKRTWTNFSRIRAAALSTLSGQTIVSRILVIFLFLCNMISIVIYLIEASRFHRKDCGTVRDDSIQIVYLVLCGIFVVHYIVRFISATDKLYFWLDIYSIVDHFTVGPTFYNLYTNSNWIGLRFLRLLFLLQLPEILQLMHLLKSSSRIRLTQIASIFISIWFTSSGFVHLCENAGDPFYDYSNSSDRTFGICIYWMLVTMSTVGYGDFSPSTDIGRAFVALFILGTICENTGDPFRNYDNNQDLGYWMAVYWLLVTMSTVGFGEVHPSTDIGRAFIVIFIIGTFAMFTAIVPELVRNLGHSTKYHKPYKRVYGKRHIVVCGCINYDSVSLFIRNFIHEDSEISGTDVVFVDNQKPDLELEAFFKRHFSGVTYLQGSVMELVSLKNSKIRNARACLILADRNATDPSEEDAANIMRATSIKNFDPNIRIIIQLLQYQNKTYLLNIPNWNWDKTGGDDVICISELKLGLMAQNCLAPGISTYMANLFTMRSYKGSLQNSWMDSYRYGAANEIYVETFSAGLGGLTFAQAAEVCFTELGVLLVAIQDEAKPLSRISINPQNAIITPTTIGFFFAQSPEETRRVKTYIPSNTGIPDDEKKLGFRRKRRGSNADKLARYFIVRKPSKSLPVSIPLNGGIGEEQQVLDYLEGVGSRLANQQGGPVRVRQSDVTLSRRPSIDVKGGRKLINPEEVYDYTGMFYWCPTRDFDDYVLNCSNIKEKNFQKHVVLCLLSEEQSPLVGLMNFVMPLRTSNFLYKDLMDIVILGNPDFIRKEWDSLSNFPKIYVYAGSPSRRPDLRAVNVERCNMCVILSAKKKIIVDQTMLDKETILTNLNVKGMSCGDVEERIQSIGVLANPHEFRREMEQFYEIPMLTELEIDSNVTFLDQDDEDDPDTPLYLTQPFACGTTFAASCLDSLMSATFTNRKILTLARAMITGSETAEFEQILAEGLGIVRRHTATEIASAKDRSHLTILPLDSGLLSTLEPNDNYGTLFAGALKTYGILCLGLYRLLPANSKGKTTPNVKRFVITNPPYNFELSKTDRVYCYTPSTLKDSQPGGTRSGHSSTDSLNNNDLDTMPTTSLA